MEGFCSSGPWLGQEDGEIVEGLHRAVDRRRCIVGHRRQFVGVCHCCSWLGSVDWLRVTMRVESELRRREEPRGRNPGAPSQSWLSRLGGQATSRYRSAVSLSPAWEPQRRCWEKHGPVGHRSCSRRHSASLRRHRRNQKRRPQRHGIGPRASYPRPARTMRSRVRWM